VSDGLEVAVHVDPGVELPFAPDRVRAAVEFVLRAEAAEQAEVSVALVGDDRIAELNRQYLDRDGPTDVISFPLGLPGQPLVVGDIYIGAAQAERQAADLGVPLDEEVLRLAVHGTLHVLGYDHPEDEDRDASPMYRRQEKLLVALLADEADAG
jgi:probable rRNA maturation factor